MLPSKNSGAYICKGLNVLGTLKTACLKLSNHDSVIQNKFFDNNSILS